MTTRSYPRLTIEEFGKQLLETGDLDPIYIALCKMKMSRPQLGRWLVAYWCFYSAGVASYMSEKEGTTFWIEMHVAAQNRVPSPTGMRWERGKERRHFRGLQGVKAVVELNDRYPTRPDGMVDYLSENETDESLKFSEVSARVQEHRSFGTWISFKVGDMLERVVGVPVDFTESEIFMFDTPRKAAIMLYDLRAHASVNLNEVSERDKIAFSVAHLSEHFKGYSVPPNNNRPIGLQEIETILCKWKSHVSGHYPLMNDTIEITEGLRPWQKVCETAATFLEVMPRSTS